MTRMIRPCVLPAKLKNVGILTILGAEEAESNDPVVFDAFRFEGFKYERSTSYALEEYYVVKIYLTNPNSVVLRYFPEKGIEALIRQTVYLVNEALNAPVQVTQAVLDAMNKVPEAQFWHVEGSVNTRLKWDDALKTFTVNGQTLSITDYIQSDCPLALEALLKFYTDGTPVVVQ